MPFDHEEGPRFTSEQRDAVLNLAARLQGEHEATVGADELARTAEEAGINPRFVQEAAMRMGQKTPPLPRSLLVAFGFFLVQACFFVSIQNPPLPGGRMISGLELSFAFAMAFFLGLWAARVRSLRWYIGLVPLGMWTALFFVLSLYTTFNGIDQFWALGHWMAFGLVQAAAALFGAVGAAGLDRLDAPARDRHVV